MWSMIVSIIKPLVSARRYGHGRRPAGGDRHGILTPAALFRWAAGARVVFCPDNLYNAGLF